MQLEQYVCGVSHVGIPTADLTMSVKFFESIGFTQIHFAVNSRTKKRVSFLQLADLVIELYESEPDATGKRGAINHIALEVRELDALFEYFKASGCNMLDSEVQFLPFWENGVRFFTIEGVNGELLEFCSKV